jgi:hypothetical protein
MLGTILIVILILALLGALPRWSHSRDWGYYPIGGAGLILFRGRHSISSRAHLSVRNALISAPVICTESGAHTLPLLQPLLVRERSYLFSGSRFAGCILCCNC